MRRSIELCGTVMLCLVAASCADLPAPKEPTSAPATPKPADPAAAQADATESYASDPGTPATSASRQRGGRRETLMCTTGTEDRHARIGVELENGQVAYFAYYSKWKPRTCSLDARRGDPSSRWTDNGTYSTVTLPGQKGRLRIEHKDGAYRFAFHDVDRVRYCGMQGKINGSLTVMRGKSNCIVQGVMDGHSS